jgi:hypothetical protein
LGRYGKIPGTKAGFTGFEEYTGLRRTVYALERI